MSDASQHREAIRRAMKPAGDFLSEKGAAYAVVGSVAGISHGYGRVTIDVDVLAEVGVDLANEFEAR